MFGVIKPYLYGAIAILVLTLAIMGFRWFKGIQAEVGNLREANAEYSIQVNAMTIQKESDAVVITALTNAQVMMQEALVIVNDQFGEIREIREQQKRVLDGSRLARFAAERAQRMEDLSNRATQDRVTEFEGVINEDF